MSKVAPTGRPGALRPHAGAALVGVLVALATLCVAEPAGATVTAFTMSPAAGPPGTVVRVRGGGCAPGVLASPDANFVTVTATTLDVAFRAPVAANGTWSGTFTVPRDGAGAPGTTAPVTAACVSSNVPSLTTVYRPLVFTVTASTVTTNPEPPTTGEPTPSTVYLPGDPASVVGLPTSTRQRVDGTRTGSSDASTRRERATARAPSGAARSRRSEPATLEPAGVDMHSAATTRPGLSWLGGTLVLVLALATLTASGYVWRLRHPHDAMPGGAA